jgi:type IV secretory pathway VirB10-like protein
VLEAGFLILLAVVVGLADLSPALIVLVMTVGWLLVALIEYFAWRQTVGFTAMGRHATVEQAPVAAVHEEVVEDAAPPPPPPPPTPTPPPVPVEEETIVTPPQAEAPPADLDEATDFQSQRLILHSLEPLQPRPRRRWIIFGPRERREGDSEEER